MIDRPVSAAVAARRLGVTPTTVRRWIASGAPCERRDRPCLVRVSELERWRSKADVLAAVARGLLDTLSKPAVDGQTAATVLGLEDWRAALLLGVAFDFVSLAIQGEWPDTDNLPAAIMRLREIANERENVRSCKLPDIR